MNKRYSLPVLALLLCVQSLYAQFRINNSEGSPLRKLQLAELAIDNLYVDSVDEKKLVEDAIRGMLDKLDPHWNWRAVQYDRGHAIGYPTSY